MKLILVNKTLKNTQQFLGETFEYAEGTQTNKNSTRK